MAQKYDSNCFFNPNLLHQLLFFEPVSKDKMISYLKKTAITTFSENQVFYLFVSLHRPIVIQTVEPQQGGSSYRDAEGFRTVLDCSPFRQCDLRT